VCVGVAATGPFGAAVLERLAAERELAWLLTRPDRPQGRGRRVAAPPAKTAAEQLGLEVRQPERLGPEVELDADVVVVADFGALIPAELLDRALWLNVHPSLLPRWRGAAPVERAILAGDRQTGVTIHQTVEALDAGPIAEQEAFPLGPDDDAGAVYERCAGLAVRLLGRALEDASKSALRARLWPQAEQGATYAAKLTPADRLLDPEEPAELRHRRIRALSPHVGARTELHGRPVTIWRARLEGGELVPEVVQPDGGRRMPYEAFLRGLR
jgi:methionyl-tRNA formyltransferase